MAAVSGVRITTSLLSRAAGAALSPIRVKLPGALLDQLLLHLRQIIFLRAPLSEKRSVANEVYLLYLFKTIQKSLGTCRSGCDVIYDDLSNPTASPTLLHNNKKWVYEGSY